MESSMDHSSPRLESGTDSQVETKSTLLRLVVFILLLFVTYWLASWLHPLGAHRFFSNLALGALTFHLALRLLPPHLNKKSAEAKNHQQFMEAEVRPLVMNDKKQTEIPVSRSQLKRLRELFKL